jgi:hypothetical protein
MPRERIDSPYPRFADIISEYQARGEIPRNTSGRWRTGNLPKSVMWLAERPATLLALYRDLTETVRDSDDLHKDQLCQGNQTNA